MATLTEEQQLKLMEVRNRLNAVKDDPDQRGTTKAQLAEQYIRDVEWLLTLAG